MKGEAVTERPVILFDGVCNLCNAAVGLVLELDTRGHFDFASLQSEFARIELRRVGVAGKMQTLPDSIVLIDSAGVHIRSSAALRIAGGLRFPFSLLRWCVVVPRPIRDAIYDLIARNRYRWWGRRDICMTPTPDVAARFLDREEDRATMQCARPTSVSTDGQLDVNSGSPS
jgi:predicted DCC family thiol-disulfide oxidoreductase YuxK